MLQNTVSKDPSSVERWCRQIAISTQQIVSGVFISFSCTKHRISACYRMQVGAALAAMKGLILKFALALQPPPDPEWGPSSHIPFTFKRDLASLCSKKRKTGRHLQSDSFSMLFPTAPFLLACAYNSQVAVWYAWVKGAKHVKACIDLYNPIDMQMHQRRSLAGRFHSHCQMQLASYQQSAPTNCPSLNANKGQVAIVSPTCISVKALLNPILICLAKIPTFPLTAHLLVGTESLLLC